MSDQRQDPAEQIEHRTHQLEQDLERLEGHIDEAREHLAERQADAERLERVEDVAGDWDEKRPDPDHPQGDDPAK